MIDGVQYRRSTKHTDYDLARTQAREFARAVRAGEPQQEMPTFGAWVLKYLQKEAKLRKGAVERDPPLLKPALRVWKDRPLDTIKPSDCASLLVDMQAASGSAGTVWLRCIRTQFMFRLAVADGLIARNPWKGLPVPKPAKRGRTLTREEESVLQAKLGPRWARLVTVVVGTGLRREEVIRITPAHRVGGMLRLTADMTKNGRPRNVPLRPEVERALDEQMPSPDYQGRYWPVDHCTPTAVLRHIVTMMGWPRLTLHDLRRTFGTRCAEAGMPMVYLQEIMGHKDIKTTRDFYVHLSEASVKDSLLKLDI
jgi:integrase